MEQEFLVKIKLDVELDHHRALVESLDAQALEELLSDEVFLHHPIGVLIKEFEVWELISA